MKKQQGPKLIPNEPGVAPGHLRPETQAWWQAIYDKYDLDDHHLQMLTLAGEELDAAARAQADLDAAGSDYVQSKGGRLMPHPAVKARRDAKITFARLMRELGLKAPEPDAPKPYGWHAGRLRGGRRA